MEGGFTDVPPGADMAGWAMFGGAITVVIIIAIIVMTVMLCRYISQSAESIQAIHKDRAEIRRMENL